MKPGRKQELSDFMALLQHVALDPVAYAEPRPLSRAFDAVPAMLLACDVGALLDELARLRLFVVEIRDFDAMLVPAESASAGPGKADSVNPRPRCRPNSQR